MAAPPPEAAAAAAVAPTVVPENLEWSLPVPSVKELAMRRPEKVPPRYVHHQRDDGDGNYDDRESDCDGSDDVPVPLIDMSKLLDPTTQREELQNLHSACSDWGLFQLINHGISDSSSRNMKEQVEEFFNLPLLDKKRWAQKPGSLEGYGQAFVVSEEQKLEWCDMILLNALPIHKRKLSFWPDHPQKFKETLGIYSENVREVAVSILEYMGMALEVESRVFSEDFRDGKYLVRMNCYPPCPEPERVVGVVPHMDNSGITLLLECSDLGGLQVLKDGHWVTVQPMHNAIVVIAGTIIEIMSNGIYKAAEHRAMVNRWKERFSIVTFCFPNESAIVGPARELLASSGSQPLYTTLTVEEYFQRFYNQKLDGTPFINALKI